MDEFISQQSDLNHDYIPEYVEAVLKESMRRYPTASSGSIRRVTDPNGYTLVDKVTCEKFVVPKDSWIAINIFSIQNSKHIWGEDALEFKPERWLSSTGGSYLYYAQFRIN